MASDLLSVAVAFQPDAPENKLRRAYDERARAFVTQLNSITQSQWQKGADTQQDVLTVCAAHRMLWAPLTS
jgi:COP9 signalosome complex subunit 3